MKVVRYRPEVTNRIYRKKHRIKMFLLVFGIIAGVALFSYSLIFMIQDVRHFTEPDPDDVPDPTPKKPAYSASDTINILNIGVSYTDELEYVTIVGFSPGNERVRVCTFSDKTRIEGIAGGKSLREIYADSGTDGITAAMEDIAKIKVFGYFLLDFSGTTKFYDVFNGCKVYLDQDITYITSDSVMGIIAAKGDRRFVGRELVRLFSYRGWQNGEYDRAYFISKATAATVNENLSGGTAAKYSVFYSSMVNKVSSNISASDFEKVKNRIFYLARCNAMGQGICGIYKIVPPDKGGQSEDFVVTGDTVSVIRSFFAQ